MQEPRILRRGSRGRDVLAWQRALQRKGFRPTGRGNGAAPTQSFGEHTVDQTKAFQRAYKVFPDGVVGPITFKKMVESNGFDSYGKYLIAQVQANIDKKRKATARSKVLSAALFAYAHRPRHYTQSALRWQGINERCYPPKMWDYADCSAFATWCFWCAIGGGPDIINGQNWKAGYTGTMTRFGRPVSYLAIRPGDVIFYGGSYSIPEHVAVYVGNGRVVSHGSEGGPFLVPSYYRVDYSHARSYLP